MKKAKVILTAVGLLAVLGGAFAFKATRTSGLKLYYTTTRLSVISNNKTYVAVNPLGFCVSSTNPYWVSTLGALTTAYRPTLSPAPTTVTATATDGSGVIGITTYSCPSTYLTFQTIDS